MAAPEFPEQQLIIAAQRGDTGAFDALVRQFQDVAFRTAWIILRNEQEAQEATQTAFIKAWSSLENFRREAPFKPWLLRIVANEAKNFRDAEWRWRQVHRTVSDYFSAAESGTPEELVTRFESSKELLEAISGLSESDQQVILLRYALELTEREMAEILNIPNGTVKSRLSRALHRLKGMMTNDIP